MGENESKVSDYPIETEVIKIIITERGSEMNFNVEVRCKDLSKKEGILDKLMEIGKFFFKR